VFRVWITDILLSVQEVSNFFMLSLLMSDMCCISVNVGSGTLCFLSFNLSVNVYFCGFILSSGMLQLSDLEEQSPPSNILRYSYYSYSYD